MNLYEAGKFLIIILMLKILERSFKIGETGPMQLTTTQQTHGATDGDLLRSGTTKLGYTV